MTRAEKELKEAQDAAAASLRKELAAKRERDELVTLVRQAIPLLETRKTKFGNPDVPEKLIERMRAAVAVKNDDAA